MTRQSLWPSYDHSDLAQKIEKKDNMRKTNGNICQCKGRAKPKKGEKKGSTLLSVARYVLDNRLDKNRISAELGISVRAVEINIRNIKEKIGKGEVISGLSNMEEGKLLEVLAQGEETKRKEQKPKWNKKEHKARWNLITVIMRVHVVDRMFSEGFGVADIAKMTGLRRRDVRNIIEGIKGFSIDDLAREMFREMIGVAEIARQLGMAQKDVKKALPRVVKAPKTFKPSVSEVRRNSTIKPGSPKSQRKLKKRPASISRTGLAAWCMQHYDENGKLILPYGCTAPSDLPRKYPEIKESVGRAEPKESYFPAPPPSIADGTARGRRRIGYLQLG